MNPQVQKTLGEMRDIIAKQDPDKIANALTAAIGFQLVYVMRANEQKDPEFDRMVNNLTMILDALPGEVMEKLMKAVFDVKYPTP